MKNIIKALKSYKSYLQTAGLICGDDERDELVNLLSRAGLVRITDGGSMSEVLPGDAHDGDYPLRRYTKTLDIIQSQV